MPLAVTVPASPALSCALPGLRLHVLHDSKCATPQGVEPVLRTYNTLIIACNMCNQPREAMAVYKRMLDEGYTPNATTYNALISAHGKAGQLDKARPAQPSVQCPESALRARCRLLCAMPRMQVALSTSRTLRLSTPPDPAPDPLDSPALQVLAAFQEMVCKCSVTRRCRRSSLTGACQS